MPFSNPLRPLHDRAGAAFLPYGAGDAAVEVVETFGPLELEYAAVRKGCALLDLPHRGVLRVGGADRVEYLNRMVTQELAGFGPFSMRRSFWLNRKGRIDADLRLVDLPGFMLADVDIHAAGQAARTLGEFVFTEDVSIEDKSADMHRLALHGPESRRLLADVSEAVQGPGVAGLEEGGACVVGIEGVEVVVARDDSAGEVGLELFVPVSGVEAVYGRLMEESRASDLGHVESAPTASGAERTGQPGGPDGGTGAHRLRPIGWHAYNLARIEAGTPLYNIDFGPDTLPHESGILEHRVSFTKGCYLGQEVVARMHSLGRPKRRLVALRIVPETATQPNEVPQPVGGAHIHPGDDPGGKVLGAVTSSAISPMLGGEPVCFAMVKTDHTEPGTELTLHAEGAYVKARVQEKLRFWPNIQGRA